MLRSKKGISPILATLLLIAIAVGAILITYAWVVTFTGTQTQQAGAVLVIENTRFYNVTATNYTDVTLRNSGSSSARIAAVYWSDTGYSTLVELDATVGDYTMVPPTGVVDPLDSIKITIEWGKTTLTPGAWTSGQIYYFKVVTEAGQYLEFTGRAP